MKSCADPYGEERKGRDAARWGERHDYEHRERMREARWESDSCDAHYARGYKCELRRQEAQREEEEAEQRRIEERWEHERAEQARLEESWSDAELDEWSDEEETLRLAEEMNDEEPDA